MTGEPLADYFERSAWLHLAGAKRDTFGMPDPNLKDIDQTGPLAELLA